MIQPQYIEQADAIRQRHDDDNNKVRSRTELTPDAQRALIAKNYLAAKSQMTDLQQSAGTNTVAAKAKAGREAFGVQGISGDPASVSISYRDAQDRADSLNDPNDAAKLLARAERSGDEPLARAVAARALEMYDSSFGGGSPAWASVVDDFTATRPRAATAVQTILDLADGPMTARAMFAWVLPKPLDLGTVDGYQLQSLADGTQTFANGAP